MTDEERLAQAREKIGQAYQVVGYLCGTLDYWPKGNNPRPTEAEMTRALDYLVDEDAFDPDFLPWPREERA